MNQFIKETRHIGITITNMEKSLNFYRDLLGLKVVRSMDESGNYIDNMLDISNVKVSTVKMSANNGTTLIELLEFKSHPKEPENMEIYRIGTSHVAFTVIDLEKCYEILLNSGVKFNAQPQLSPDGYAKVTFCHDPDGTLIELVQVLDDWILNKEKKLT